MHIELLSERSKTKKKMFFSYWTKPLNYVYSADILQYIHSYYLLCIRCSALTPYLYTYTIVFSISHIEKRTHRPTRARLPKKRILYYSAEFETDSSFFFLHFDIIVYVFASNLRGGRFNTFDIQHGNDLKECNEKIVK